MGTKEEFIRRMQSRLDQWNAEIDVLNAKADLAEAEARAEYYKQVEALRSKRNDARSKLYKLESAGEGAWEDLTAGVEQAWDEVSAAVRSAAERFR